MNAYIHSLISINSNKSKYDEKSSIKKGLFSYFMQQQY